MPGYSVWLRAWQVQVGRVQLYLLDSNDPANTPAHRGITSELYGGGAELRLKQELVLGIGGWRLLRALGIEPEVCHLNEGHAAFAVLERARTYMDDSGQSFDVALTVTRAGNLFTTHTPVEGRFDRFTPDAGRAYLGALCRGAAAASRSTRLLALGRRDIGRRVEPFNMAYLAIRGSGAVNGVSRLHGEVSRRIFQPLSRAGPRPKCRSAHVTNGVHMPTWDSAEADASGPRRCGKERWRGRHARASSADFRDARRRRPLAAARRSARSRSSRTSATGWRRHWRVRATRAGRWRRRNTIFDPDALTLGFARRFATYKRPNLLLHDPDRLLRILTHPRPPGATVIAGKAHPGGRAGTGS